VLRVWLDSHLSPALARALRERGYDVVALQDEPRSLRSLPDELLLADAARQGRAIVTYNARDFAPLHKVFLAGRRSHAGIVLISSRAIRQDDIGGQLRALAAFVDEHAGETDLRDRLVWVKPVSR
jgi:predicted nuclease of predicted toxin-antitoxin system